MRIKLTIMAAILAALVCVCCGVVPAGAELKRSAAYLLFVVVPFFAADLIIGKHLDSPYPASHSVKSLINDAKVRFFSKCSSDCRLAIGRLEKVERAVLCAGYAVIALLAITRFPVPLMRLVYSRPGTLFFFPTQIYLFALASYIFLGYLITTFAAKRVTAKCAGDYRENWLEYKESIQPFSSTNPITSKLILFLFIFVAVLVFGSYVSSYARITRDGIVLSERAGFDEKLYDWDSIKKVTNEIEVRGAEGKHGNGIEVMRDSRVYFADGTDWTLPDLKDSEILGLKPQINSAFIYISKHVKHKK